MELKRGDLVSAVGYNSFYVLLSENNICDKKSWMCKCIFTEITENIPENIISVVQENYKKKN